MGHRRTDFGSFHFRRLKAPDGSMGAPPRDSEGRVVPHDDADIPGDAYVLRYIVSAWLKPHQSVPGRRRLSSAAFSPSSKRHDPYQGMSVGLLQPMLDAGLSPTDRMGDRVRGHRSTSSAGPSRASGFKSVLIR